MRQSKEERMIITLENDFHNTEVRLRVPRLPYKLSERQINRAWKELCGISICFCCGHLGERGQQEVIIEPHQLANGTTRSYY